MRPLSILLTSLRNELIAFLLFLAIWSVTAIFTPVYVIPSPLVVVNSFPGYLPQNFGHHLALTGMRVAIGFGISFVISSLLGALVFTKDGARSVTAIMSALNVLPGMVLGVIFLLLFGIGSAAPITLVAILTLPTLTINTINSLMKRNTNQEQYLTSIGAQTSHFAQTLYLPALVPTLLSNLSLGIGLAIKVVIMGEFIGSQDGLGYLLNVARNTFNMKEVFFYLAALLVFTLLYQSVLSLLSTTLFRKYYYA
jgi:NitT/TauT family transport system permease protein